MSAWRLLLTRPQAESEVLGQVLAQAGIFSVSLPLLETQALPVNAQMQASIAHLQRYAVVVVVSKAAARAAIDLMRQQYQSPPVAVHWFSVGAGTAQVLDQYLEPYGQHTLFPEQGDDSEALLAMPSLWQALDVETPRALIMRGQGGRELIADSLRARGVAVDYLELYQRLVPAYRSNKLIDLVNEHRLNALSVSSAQGLEHLHLLAGAAWSELVQLPLLVPSPRVAERARAIGATQVIDCRGASAAAVLSALRSHEVAPAIK